MSECVIRLDVRTYWLHARGEGGGADFDLVMERDWDGLPMLRGRHVAGLLRLALVRAAKWRWFGGDPLAEQIPELLMGSDGIPGCLDVRSATVPQPLQHHLCQSKDLIAACFHRLATTAIDENGVARQKHLRAVEAAMPIPLEARLAFAGDDRRAWGRNEQGEVDKLAAAERLWRSWIKLALPALDEIGAKRTRGFGRMALPTVVSDLSEARE